MFLHLDIEFIMPNLFLHLDIEFVMPNVSLHLYIVFVMPNVFLHVFGVKLFPVYSSPNIELLVGGDNLHTVWPENSAGI